MAEFKGYYYNHQLRRYLVQFMAIFADMQVQVGHTTATGKHDEDTPPRLIKVPIKNRTGDRVVADVIAENTKNKTVRLPLMTAGITGLQMAPERRHGVGTVNRQSFLPSGGIVPHDMRVAKTRMPVPYVANFELSMWCSNQDQHHQLLEQILMIINPILEIQTSDDVLDPTRISSVELVGIQIEDEPAGTERQLIRATLNFDVVVYISCPAQEYANIVHNIFVRVAAVANDTDFNYPSDTIAAIENTGLDYERWFSTDDIDFPQD